jgi:glutamate dehydrogenase
MNNRWQDELQEKLIALEGRDKGLALFEAYYPSIATDYCTVCSPELAVSDIQNLERLSAARPFAITLYQSADSNLHMRLFQLDHPLPLADVLPTFENLDLRTYSVCPYQLEKSAKKFWINDFTVQYVRTGELQIEKINTKLAETFFKTQYGICENDGFNKLVLGAQLSWHEIVVLRAYAKYLKQIGFRFSQDYIQQALVNNALMAKDLINYFLTKFSSKCKSEQIIEIESNILLKLEDVVNRDEDEIIRRILELIKATLRTNYFKHQANQQPTEYLSMKLNSRDITDLPLPSPLYEIFTYSPRFEGIHLRNEKVARGGIRLSDRREDFRTEILGLMKAQKVKNAIIIPSGAKGGFVLKSLASGNTRETIQANIIHCYQSFIRSLLDLTDNLKNGKAIKPSQVVCYDDDDPYLVVAADKGTATFSDTANSISKEYNFWLGDAFASGGSTGYDHKKMGITARGAWESVKRHFYELDINVFENDFTVIGIGDMSGDVFGNGLIYTPHSKLVAAFDHRHIFLDPNPNPETTYQERIRLFNLSISSWEDFNPTLISSGGGVYKRSSKTIPLSPQVQTLLGIKTDRLSPNQLIRALLKAPIDLLWIGGIGTYVKSTQESHAEVGDKANDYCRINGMELRCKVVGEGGNLGFTQLGRIEYALNGGFINTDFIDNSAGVDCSDHEVNIKILLDNEIQKQKIDEKQRNKILLEMTQEVADSVLRDNYNQALTMNLANFHSTRNISKYIDYIGELEANDVLNRAVEFLPDDKNLFARRTAGISLTRPELAILLAYTKIHLKTEILNSDIPQYPFFTRYLYSAFPASLQQTYTKELANHILRNEIIATQLSNQVINETNILFVHNLQYETSASVSEIVRSYIMASEIFSTSELLRLIESFDNIINPHLQYQLFGYIHQLTNRATRWFLRHKEFTFQNLEKNIAYFIGSIQSLDNLMPTLISDSLKRFYDSLSIEFIKVGIPIEHARRITSARAMHAALNIIEVASKNQSDLFNTAKIYYTIDDKFNFSWFRSQIAKDSREGYWESLTRLTLRDEFDSLQKKITQLIIKNYPNAQEDSEVVELWISEHESIRQHWEKMLKRIQNSNTVDYITFFLAIRELSHLIQTNNSSINVK